MNSNIKIIVSMAAFGTIGLFVRSIPLPSGFIAMLRGIIGGLFLLAYSFLTGKHISLNSVKSNLPILIISGAAIGINWILLFESYRFTTVATATLCYYLEPIFLIIISAFIFKEKITVKKMLCVFLAFFGMICVSGVFENTVSFSDVKGIMLGVGAAIFYTAVIILNKYLKNIESVSKTTIQLFAAAIVIIPYSVFCENTDTAALNVKAVILLLIIGVVHTGIAYTLYFGAVEELPAQTVAVLSYIDPAVAVLLSVAVLKESMSIIGALGAALILISALISELPKRTITPHGTHVPRGPQITPHGTHVPRGPQITPHGTHVPRGPRIKK